MAADLDARLRELMALSLATWQLPAEVAGRADGSFIVTAKAAGTARRPLCIRVARAPLGLPFRWLVTIGDRERPAASIVGVLGLVRAALDPAQGRGRARIAASSLVPP